MYIRASLSDAATAALRVAACVADLQPYHRFYHHDHIYSLSFCGPSGLLTGVTVSLPWLRRLDGAGGGVDVDGGAGAVAARVHHLGLATTPVPVEVYHDDTDVVVEMASHAPLYRPQVVHTDLSLLRGLLQGGPH